MKQMLSDAIEDFTRFRRSQNTKKGTLASHGTVLRRFLTVNGNIYTDKINDVHVTRYFEEASKTRQPQTLRVDHTALSVFFDWCRHTRRMSPDNNPLYGRRMPKLAKKERSRLNVSEFKGLLEAAGERCPRDRAAVAVLLYTLLRDQEVADLRVRDVDLTGGWLVARIHKTNQEDRMPISEELDSELRRWLTAYTEEVGPLDPNYRLIPARRVGWEMNEQGRFSQVSMSLLRPERSVGKLGRIVTPSLEAIGFPVVDIYGKPCGEGAHTIRRSGARALFDNLAKKGYDGALRVVQSLLHHESVTTTERYIGVTADKRTRDEILRGHTMYPASTENVTPLRREAAG